MKTGKKPGKFPVIFQFLKGSIHLFVLSLVFSMSFTFCNAMTPQIIRYAVDHILTGEGNAEGKHGYSLQQERSLQRQCFQGSSTISAR